MTEEEYKEWKENQPRYEYETQQAKIVEIDTRHWFATTHWYTWDIEVYYEPYDLSYSENGQSSGSFNAPSFFNKREGDIITIKIRNTYIKDELVDREISRIQ